MGAHEGVLAVFITTPVFVMINTMFSFLSFPIIVAILIYRSRHFLNARERAATKWIILSLSIFIPTVILVFFVLPAVVPADSLALLIVNLAGFFGCGINIAGILMAVLYANAFDIDVFVRRTLVYTLLTAILTAVYVGLVIGLSALLSGIISQASSVAIVISTLAIYWLFQPLRRRIQRSIDRRFYRSKYNAAKTVAAFSATLRQEVDLDQLREQLLAVVQQTMQPTFVSLWLRPPEHDEKQRASWRATPPGSSEGG